jgi:hypothetical protein
MDACTNNADATIALAFVNLWFGATEQPVYICSLANERGDVNEPSERHLSTRNADELTRFIAKWDRARRGLFFCVSTVHANKVRNKDNVAEIPGLWADIDFKNVIDDEASILRRVKTLPLPPSIIVRSGNGLHLYWKFKEPLAINTDSAETIERVGAALKLLADLVGADMQVTQVAALMRLPGTHNSKRDEWKPVEIESSGDREYGLDDIETMLYECAPIVLRKVRPSQDNEIDPYAAVLKSMGFKPPVDVPKRLAAMTYMGGNDAGIHGTQLSVSASLLTAGVDVEEVVSLVLEATRAAAGDYGMRWNWKIEERELRKACATWVRKLEKEDAPPKPKVTQPADKDGTGEDAEANDGGDDDDDGDDGCAITNTNGKGDIRRLNKIHAVLPIGSKTRVVTFGELDEFPGRETIVMTQGFGDFAALLNKYRHKYKDKKGVDQEMPMGTYWLLHRNRRQYDGGMAFMPKHNKGSVGDKLNLWRGYGVNAVKPDGKSGAAGCGDFLAFMLDVMCSGNNEHFEYLRKREAVVLQQRIRTEIALGWRSDEEGVGKGFYENTMGHLLGHHAMQVGNPKHIIGAFNPHLETLLRLTADEALFVGNPEHRNVLFGLITEPKLTIRCAACRSPGR